MSELTTNAMLASRKLGRPYIRLLLTLDRSELTIWAALNATLREGLITTGRRRSSGRSGRPSSADARLTPVGA